MSGRTADYRKVNFEYWQSEYETTYPDTTLVKLYHHILKSKLKPPQGKKMLDYGCSNGTNTSFFRDLGFEIFGADINHIAIEKAQRVAALWGGQDHFVSIDMIKSPTDDLFFDGNFDLIVSWYTLYYLSDTDLDTCVHSLYHHLRPGGYFVASMVGSQTGNYEISRPANDGMHVLPVIERLKDLHGTEHFVNFTESYEDLIEKFGIFTVQYVGYIDEAFDVTEESKNNLFHYIFVGQKDSN